MISLRLLQCEMTFHWYFCQGITLHHLEKHQEIKHRVPLFDLEY